MKIRHAACTGCIVGQFVVEAESEAERLLIQMFCTFPWESKKEWRFHFHGASYSSDRDGAVAFNFGYIEVKPESTSGGGDDLG